MSAASQKSSPNNRTTQRRRWLYRILGALILIALVVVTQMPQPVPADFGEVTQGLLRVTLDEEGETRVRDRYVVSAPLAGRVLRIELEPGDAVVAGETALATFQPSDPTLLDARSAAEAEARVQGAEAALGLARADRDRIAAELRFAEAELGRYRRLAADEIVSAERLESAELEAATRSEALEAAEFAIRSAHHDLQVAKARLLQGQGQGQVAASGGNPAGPPITITSPIDGVVLRRLRESESIVPAGEPLLEVADPSRLEIVSDYLSTDAVKIDAGSRVLIEQWGGDRPLEGMVRLVEPSGFTKVSALGVEEQRVNVVIDFEDPQGAWQALGDGFRVEVRVVIHENPEAAKIPSSALFRHGDGWAVYRVDGERAVLTPIDIGRRNAVEAEVVGGLDVGATVVLHPSDALTDGQQVEARTLTQ